MLFKPNALVYIHRNGLFVVGKDIAQARLSFGPELVHNLEVVNADKLVDTSQEFFEGNSLGGKRVLMVLDYSVVFEKKIVLDEANASRSVTDAFIAAVPFVEGQRTCLTLYAKNSVRLFATNADLYQTIASALHGSDISKLVAVTPAAAYNLANVERTASSLAQYLFNDTDGLKQKDLSLAQTI